MSAPWLEVISGGWAGPTVGTKLSLDRRSLTIGSSISADVMFTNPLLAPRHCTVFFELGRWWLRDLGGVEGTFVAGVRIHDEELAHGSCFELPGGVRLRLWLEARRDARAPAMEQAIWEQPDDASRWLVYADWLQEQGSGWGKRIVESRPEPRHAGALAAEITSGELELSWAHGMVSRAVLRSLEPRNVTDTNAWRGPARLRERLRWLVEEPAFRFLRELEVDVGSFVTPGALAASAVELASILSGGLLGLEHVRIGPSSASTWPDVAAVFSKVAASHPQLKTEEGALFRAWGPASLLDIQGTSRLELHAAVTVNELHVRFGDDRWWAFSLNTATPLRLNDRPATSVQLRSGDVLLSGSSAFRFEA